MTTGLVAGTGYPPSPPISVIAEELGYFPVTTTNGDVTYVPKRVSRKSSPQAIELAKVLREKGATMYAAYWCPHCSRQKELFGLEAWSIMNVMVFRVRKCAKASMAIQLLKTRPER